MRLSRLRVAVCAGALALLAGCSPVGSIHALYRQDEAPYLAPSLLGTWRNANPKVQQTWVVKKGKRAGTYDIEITEATPTTPTGSTDRPHGHSSGGSWAAKAASVRLVKLGEATFVDCLPEPSTTEKDFASVAGWPGPFPTFLHAFQRVWIERDRVRLAYLNRTWWEQQKRQKTLGITVEEVTDCPEEFRDVITSSTDELRAFVTRAAADPKAFAPEVVLVRAKPVAPSAKKPRPAATRRKGRH